jgi:GNAT superfamily N-acetyltransferase
MNVSKLEADQKRKAANVLVSAYFDYSMMIHYFPDAEKRKRKLPWYMERALNCAVCYGEVFVTNDMSGVMFILPPGHTRLTTKEFIRNGFLFLPVVMGFRNYAKSDECEKFVADTHERLMKGRDHYYLWGLAVDPEKQRKGAGSALLKTLTDRSDVENMPIYLETHDQNNVAYYERFGFKLIHTDTVPKHGIDFWCMIREAGEYADTG